MKLYYTIALTADNQIVISLHQLRKQEGNRQKILLKVVLHFPPFFLFSQIFPYHLLFSIIIFIQQLKLFILKNISHHLFLISHSVPPLPPAPSLPPHAVPPPLAPGLPEVADVANDVSYRHLFCEYCYWVVL